MIDRDIAELYGVETRRLNEQVKRNIERFPEEFMFQLTREEKDYLKSQIVTSRETDSVMSQIATSSSSRSQIVTLNTGRGSNIKYFPFAFEILDSSFIPDILKNI